MKPARSEEYKAWIRGKPCLICGGGPCDAHHALPSTTAQKASDLTCIPLCRTIPPRLGHHDMALNRVAFARRFRLDVKAIIARLNREYLETEPIFGHPEIGRCAPFGAELAEV